MGLKSLLHGNMALKAALRAALNNTFWLSLLRYIQCVPNKHEVHFTKWAHCVTNIIMIHETRQSPKKCLCFFQFILQIAARNMFYSLRHNIFIGIL